MQLIAALSAVRDIAEDWKTNANDRFVLIKEACDAQITRKPPAERLQDPGAFVGVGTGARGHVLHVDLRSADAVHAATGAPSLSERAREALIGNGWCDAAMHSPPRAR